MQDNVLLKKEKELTKMFKEMFELQMKLNNDTNGEEWIQGKTNLGKKINWFRCIYMECAELIDSFPWKHWKDINSEPNIQNAQIEVVDIWHFVMSQMIKDLGVEAAIQKAIGDYQRFMNKIIKDQDYRRTSLMETTEELMANALYGLINPVIFFKIIYKIETFSIEKVYTLYIGKNCLNKFRQDNGYQIGTYKKVWGEKEDNEVLKEILDANSEISYRELYSKLFQAYSMSLKQKK